MHPLPAHSLFLGNSGDTRDLPRLTRSGIAALIDLAVNELPLTPPRELTYCRFPLIDGSGNAPAILRAAIDCTTSLLRSRTPTLIFCSAGMSRTPAIAAAALSLLTNRPVPDCLAKVCRTAPADVSPSLWADILAAIA